MAEVKLYCGVYGEATVFPVKIARGAEVSALQGKIAGILSTEQHTVPPRFLKLYLARKKEGEETKWLADDDNLDTLLRGAVDKDFTKMRPSWKLTKAELLGPDFTPGEEEIHVLVELPAAAAGVTSEKSAEQMLRELYEQLVQTKGKRYVHSRLGSSKGRELLRDLNIEVEPVPTFPFAVGAPTSADAFEWESVPDGRGHNIPLTEEQQRERYRAYVEEKIGGVLTEKKLCVLGVEKGQDILTAVIPGRDIVLAGRTDLLILSEVVKAEPSDVQWLPGVKMLIEVKKVVESGSVFQVLSELIALDLLAKDAVMALLTDLTGSWQFFWVSEMNAGHITIHKATIKTPGEAFQVIRRVLAQSPSADSEIVLPCFQKPVKRRKLAKMLPTINESSGLREAIEQYYDIASMLGPDIEMARAVGYQAVRTIPAFRSMYT